MRKRALLLISIPIAALVDAGMKKRAVLVSIAILALLVAYGMIMGLHFAAGIPSLPQSKEATSQDTNGDIAYSARDNLGHYQIYAISSTGGKLTQITKDAIDHYEPNYSPDGRNIAYSAFDGAHRQIYTIPSTEGGEPIQLTSDASYHEAPTYSPDNKTVAYVGFDGSYHQIYTIPRTGGDPTQLTKDALDHYDPHYSTDGKTITYHAADVDNNYQTYTIPTTEEMTT
jgi:Tol biopolymer transport system component